LHHACLLALLQLDPQGNLFNIYRDERGLRAITPVGNISQMQRFKVGRGCGGCYRAGLSVCCTPSPHRGLMCSYVCTVATLLISLPAHDLSFAILHRLTSILFPCMRMQISEIAGVKLDKDVSVVAMADGSSIPLPPGSGMIDKDGKVCVCVWGGGGEYMYAACAVLCCSVLCCAVQWCGCMNGKY
jgi:hypothetical protein